MSAAVYWVSELNSHVSHEQHELGSTPSIRQTYEFYSSISKGITSQVYQRLQHDYKYQNDFDYVHKRVFKVGESSAHFRNPHK